MRIGALANDKDLLHRQSSCEFPTDKYKVDIARTILVFFGDKLIMPAHFCTPTMKVNQMETSAV